MIDFFLRNLLCILQSGYAKSAGLSLSGILGVGNNFYLHAFL